MGPFETAAGHAPTGYLHLNGRSALQLQKFAYTNCEQAAGAKQTPARNQQAQRRPIWSLVSLDNPIPFSSKPLNNLF